MLFRSRSIQDEGDRAHALHFISYFAPKMNGANFQELWKASQSICKEYSRAGVLRHIGKIAGADLPLLLGAANSIQSNLARTEVLVGLAEVDISYLSNALVTALSIEVQWWIYQARYITILLDIDGINHVEMLAAACSIRSEERRVGKEC